MFIPIAATSVRRRSHRAVLGLGLLLCSTQACLAQSAAPAAELRDPAVLSRMAQMGDHLRSLKFFVVKVETSVQRVGVNPPR